MPSDAHEQLMAIANHTQIVRMNLHPPLLAAGAELKRLVNELATSTYLERVAAAELERLAEENAELNAELRALRPENAALRDIVEGQRLALALFPDNTSAGPPQEYEPVPRWQDHNGEWHEGIPPEDRPVPPPGSGCTRCDWSTDMAQGCPEHGR